MQLSYWEYDRYFKRNDVVIVGAGIVGLNAAIHLKKVAKHLNVLIVERGFLPYGASTRNAGFACFGSVSEILDDIQSTDEETVFNLIEKRWLGLQKLRALVGDKKMDFRQYGGYELFKSDKAKIYDTCIEKIPFLNTEISKICKKKNAFSVANSAISDFQFKGINGLIKNKLEGQIDTGKMMDALILKAKDLGIKIITGLDIQSVVDDGLKVQIKAANGIEFSAKKLIVCTNGFAKTLLPELNVEPARAQVLVTKPIKNLPIKGTFHYDCGYYYFRNIGKRILFGGGRNLDFVGENTTQMNITDLIQNQLKDLLKTHIIPNHPFEIERSWSGIMGIGSTKKPIVKSISKNLFCAVRMGGMGVAIGSLVGEEVAELAME